MSGRGRRGVAARAPLAPSAGALGAMSAVIGVAGALGMFGAGCVGPTAGGGLVPVHGATPMAVFGPGSSRAPGIGSADGAPGASGDRASEGDRWPGVVASDRVEVDALAGRRGDVAGRGHAWRADTLERLIAGELGMAGIAQAPSGNAQGTPFALPRLVGPRMSERVAAAVGGSTGTAPAAVGAGQATAAANPAVAGSGEELWIVGLDEVPGGNAATAGSGRLATIAPRVSRGVGARLERTDVAIQVLAHLARVDVTQRLGNRSRGVREASVAVPLPTGAVVSDFVMTVGARQIRGVVRSRRDAGRMYLRALAAGHAATLVVQERGDVLAHRVGNVAPGQHIDVTVRYDYLVPYRNGAYAVSVPLADPARDPDTVPADSAVSVEVDLDAGGPIGALRSSHALSAVEASAPSRRRLSVRGATLADGNAFALDYVVDATSPALWVHDDGEASYFALAIHPPQAPPGTAWPADAALLSDIELEVSTGSSRVGAGAAVELYPRAIPALTASQPVLVVGRVDGGLGDTLTIVGRVGGERVRPIEVPVPRTRTNPGLARLWAWAKVRSLGGADAARAEPAARVSAEIEQIARRYGIVSPWTALGAIDASRPVR